MNRYASQLGARARRFRAVALVGIAAMVSGAMLASPVHALVDIGPIDPAHGFPAWYEDENSVSLQPCLDAVMCAAPAPNPGAASVPGNFPADGAYYSATTRVLGPAGPRLDYVVSLTFGFAGGVPAVGDQITFSRFRFRATGLVPLANYTLTHPYGTRTFTATAQGAINVTEDIGCVGAPCDFAAALGGSIKPFLMWDPAAAPAAPAGFIGDPALAHPVVGSPAGTNFVKLTGTNAGGLGVNTIQTNLFNIEGQLATTLFRVPGAPASLAAVAGPDAGEASVTWVKPALDGGTKVTGYRIYGGDTPTTLAPLADVDANTLTFVDSGLGEGITRYYEVSALNAVGESVHSQQATIVTFARPTAPESVISHQGTGLGEMIVDWTPPASDGGTPVTGYIISRAQGSGAYAQIAVVGDVLRYNDSGLTPFLSYHYTVAAVNLVGAGDVSAPSCSRAYPWVPALDALLPC